MSVDSRCIVKHKDRNPVDAAIIRLVKFDLRAKRASAPWMVLHKDEHSCIMLKIVWVFNFLILIFE